MRLAAVLALLGAVGCGSGSQTILIDERGDTGSDAGTTADSPAVDGDLDASGDAAADAGVVFESGPGEAAADAPTPPNPPPCNGVATQPMNTLLACLEENCSTLGPGDPNGRYANYDDGSLGCMTNYCAGPDINLQSDSTACYNCIANEVLGGAKFGAASLWCAGQ